jgi:hypothetical protein
MDQRGRDEVGGMPTCGMLSDSRSGWEITTTSDCTIRLDLAGIGPSSFVQYRKVGTWLSAIHKRPSHILKI